MSRKLIAAVIIAVLALGSSMAMATESRVETLGNQGLYLMDDTNIFTNPATAAYYPNMLRLHMGGSDEAGDGQDMHAYGGGTVTVMDMLTVGTFFARNPGDEMGPGMTMIMGDAVNPSKVDHDGDPATPAIPGFAAQDFDGDGVLDDPYQNRFLTWENPFEIMGAFQAGPMKVGISYYLANAKIHYEDDEATGAVTEEYNGKSVLHSVKLGASMDMDGMKPEGWLVISPFSINTEDEWEDGTTIEEELTGNKFELGGRLFFPMSDSVSIVPALRWENASAEVDISNDDNTTLDELSQEYTFNSIETGVSVQYTADKLFIIGSAGILWSAAEQTIENSNTGVDYEGTFEENDFAMPVVGMGLEYMARDWLTLRGGMNTTTIWARTENVDEEEDDSGTLVDETTLATEQRTSASVGMGLHLGNLTLDATFGNWVLVNEDGGEDGNGNAGPNLYSSLDAKYVF